MDDISFGRWVQRRRRSLLLTQAELGALARCSAAAVRKIEAEERRPSPEVAIGFARALCIAPDEQPQFLRFARGLRSQPPSGDAGVYATLDSRVAGGLHLPATTLIGRKREQDDLVAILSAPDCHLVSLTGPGGTGKTRLAFAVAARLQPAYPDGVLVVSLASVRDAAHVLPTIAGAFHIMTPNRDVLLERLAAVVGTGRRLLVLDNVEHMLAAVEDVAELLRRAPALQVLVTSRERLRIAGEQVYPVAPLPLPAADSEQTAAVLAHNDAVALFLERARAARRDFAWTDAVAPSVAAICRQLDGLPLAIELAAAYMGVLTPETLATGMQRRLALLTDGPRDAPARQQTLRATIDWSYHLLSPDEQRWFARLAALVSPWSLDAAMEVCAFEAAERASVLRIVRSLVEKSLIQPAGTFGTQPFFGMLETIREYGLEHLDAREERNVIAARHAGYYTALARRAEVGFHGPEQPEWFLRSMAEMPNILAALHWLVEQRTLGDALCLIGGYGFVWPRTQYDTEWYAAFTRVQELADGDASFRYLGRALSWASFATAVPNRDMALRHAQEAVALLRTIGDDWGTAFALDLLSMTYGEFQQYDAAEAACRESLRLFESIGFRPGVSWALISLVGCTSNRGAPEAEVRALYEQCAQLARTDGSVKDLGLVHYALAWLDLQHGWYAAAAEHLRTALVQAERLQAPRSLGKTCELLAEALGYLGQFGDAHHYLERAAAYLRPLELAPWYRAGITHTRALLARLHGESVHSIHLYLEEMQLVHDPDTDALTYQTIQAGALEGIGCAVVDLGLLEVGARILSAAAAHEPEDLHALSTEALDIAEHVAVVKAQFERSEIRVAWEEGARMSLSDAKRYVVERWAPPDTAALEPANFSAV